MILTLTLAIATLGSKHVVAGETVLHDYYYYYGANPDTPAENDHLTVTVQKHAVIMSSPIPFTHGGTQYTLYAYGYAAAEASPIVHNVNETKYRTTAWCETTGDQGTLGIPSRDNIDQEKYQNDGDGGHNGDEYRWYSMDNTTEAGVAYKHHTVVSKHDNP